MLLGISTADYVGLSAVTAAFIVFALVSSFVLPRGNPNFPGSARNLYMVVALVFFGGMIAAIDIFGQEPHPAAAAGTTSATSPPAAQQAPAGSVAAGKTLFAKNGCGACHTFKPAASTGKIGPDLDDIKNPPSQSQSLEAYVGNSIADPNAYITPGFQAGVMPKFTLTSKQLDDLVAFVMSGQPSSSAGAGAAAPSSSTSSASAAPAGNAAQGKALFTSQTCATCHTFTPAGATGKVGPDLDNLAQYASKAGQPVAAFATAAITNPPAPYVPPGFPTNAMPKLPLSQQQVADLVAFLTSGS